MKTTILTLILFFLSLQLLAQFDVDKNKYAWERTSFERWDNFKPKLYFDIFAKKYKKTDRRTMATRSITMSLVAIHADNYKIYSRSIDSIYKIETNKALDKTLNKNYILFQRTRVNKLSDNFEAILDRAILANLPYKLHFAFQNQFLGYLENIDFLKAQYAPDADKYPLIEQEITKLEEQLKILTRLTQIQEMLFELDATIKPLFIEEVLEENQEEINTIIKS